MSPSCPFLTSSKWIPQHRYFTFSGGKCFVWHLLSLGFHSLNLPEWWLIYFLKRGNIFLENIFISITFIWWQCPIVLGIVQTHGIKYSNYSGLEVACKIRLECFQILRGQQWIDPDVWISKSSFSLIAFQNTVTDHYGMYPEYWICEYWFVSVQGAPPPWSWAIPPPSFGTGKHRLQGVGNTYVHYFRCEMSKHMNLSSGSPGVTLRKE